MVPFPFPFRSLCVLGSSVRERERERAIGNVFPFPFCSGIFLGNENTDSGGATSSADHVNEVNEVNEVLSSLTRSNITYAASRRLVSKLSKMGKDFVWMDRQ